MTPNQLTEIDPDEISIVRRGANRRRWLLRKSEGEMEQVIADAASVPHPNEGVMLDALRKADVSEDAQEAAIAAVRLLKAFEDDLPAELCIDIAKLGKPLYETRNEPLNDLRDDGDEDDTDTFQGDLVGDDGSDDWIVKADLSTEGRRAMARRGQALPDGSFPIPNVGFLRRAIRAFGRAGDKARAKSWIIRRARALGATNLLPDGWQVSKNGVDMDDLMTDGVTRPPVGDDTGNVNKEDTVPEGGTHAVPVYKDGTWDLSQVSDEHRPFYEMVLKAADEEKAELVSRVEKAEKTASEEREARLQREFVAKAEEYVHVAKADELGALLKEASEKLDAESFEKLEGILKAAEERIKASPIFKEYGRSGSYANIESVGDTWSQIEKAAAELVEKDGALTREKAVDKFLRSDAGKALYARYQAEMARVV